MFIIEVIGRGHVPGVPGYAADGIIVHVVIPGIEGTGDKMPPEGEVISDVRFRIYIFNLLAPVFGAF